MNACRLNSQNQSWFCRYGNRNLLFHRSIGNCNRSCSCFFPSNGQGFSVFRNSCICNCVICDFLYSNLFVCSNRCRSVDTNRNRFRCHLQGQIYIFWNIAWICRTINPNLNCILQVLIRCTIRPLLFNLQCNRTGIGYMQGCSFASCCSHAVFFSNSIKTIRNGIAADRCFLYLVMVIIPINILCWKSCIGKRPPVAARCRCWCWNSQFFPEPFTCVCSSRTILFLAIASQQSQRNVGWSIICTCFIFRPNLFYCKIDVSRLLLVLHQNWCGAICLLCVVFIGDIPAIWNIHFFYTIGIITSRNIDCSSPVVAVVQLNLQIILTIIFFKIFLVGVVVLNCIGISGCNFRVTGFIWMTTIRTNIIICYHAAYIHKVNTCCFFCICFDFCIILINKTIWNCTVFICIT